MKNKTTVIISTVFGILFLMLAFYYWSTPASLLPHFMPGYNAALATPHFKHGLGAFILAAAAFIFAWFKSGEKGAKDLPKEDHS
jgi:hypothetical protein